ncbi:Hypothetical predicted protein [Marmota monax]|uniref:Secreted protein n=1 Tax=Marmota monax TaxID=9995 RepID=A0A5E4AK19_MARMO|nr:hypothetical protein GHT09_017502 [Marmota monax]VTJ57783.1 Hypothetical predicted protein [Marmota monax]
MGWDTQGTHPNRLQILLLTYPLAVSMLWCAASCAEWTGAPPGEPLLCFTVRPRQPPPIPDKGLDSKAGSVPSLLVSAGSSWLHALPPPLFGNLCLPGIAA